MYQRPFVSANPFHARHVREVHHRFIIGLFLINGTRSVLSFWLLTSGPTPICLCKPFSCKACPGTLEGTREACFLGEQFCWRSVLPDPAPPLRRAHRPDAPVVFSVFGFDRFTLGFLFVCASEDRSRLCVLDTLEGNRQGCPLAGSSRRHSVLPSPAPLAAPPCAAPTRPARSVSGFWIRQVIMGRSFQQRIRKAGIREERVGVQRIRVVVSRYAARVV